jgi:hypothetical protein
MFLKRSHKGAKVGKKGLRWRGSEPLFVWIFRARNIVKRPRQADSQEKILIVVIWITILICFSTGTTIRDIIEVIEECLPNSKLKRKIPFRVVDILEATPERD